MEAFRPAGAARPAAGAQAAGLRPAGPPRRARAGAGEHPARLRARAGARRHHAGARRRRHRRRRGGGRARPVPQPGAHARRQRPVAGRAARPADPLADAGATAGLRRRPHPARHRYASTFASQQPVRRHAHPDAGGRCSTWCSERGAGHVRFNIETKLIPDRPDDTVRAGGDDARRCCRWSATAGMASARQHPELRLAQPAARAAAGAGHPHRLPDDPDRQQRQHARRRLDRRPPAGRPRQRAAPGEGRRRRASGRPTPAR